MLLECSSYIGATNPVELNTMAVAALILLPQMHKHANEMVMQMIWYANDMVCKWYRMQMVWLSMHIDRNRRTAGKKTQYQKLESTVGNRTFPGTAMRGTFAKLSYADGPLNEKVSWSDGQSVCQTVSTSASQLASHPATLKKFYRTVASFAAQQDS